ncbi:ribosomal protein L16 [Metschnikowia bicuspidata var. bicuspidata NRRL YB-4993]|uniref:Ribosomal protein L16 n=1 Tax=Metschnikowia bicuspidata var. bicuspidata NRRL YB-4993 TaxID=869754 RepID=A0A1A0HH16_9ASCO|nr:ribosomal protein L16 [Metschnikowia bicuspidata var. bicuspidata NRRL YB-4993]OBA23291.1 ribosomal protein L16 [Metschnikowia bicuspidata var. bicuspidata NRRL YB-4993]
MFGMRLVSSWKAAQPFSRPLTPLPAVQSIFGTITKRYKHEYAPRFKQIRKAFKGRVTVRTGGSIKGNSLEFGLYGLRLKSNGIRMTATQLKEADKVIQREIRPSGATCVTRFACNIPVCVKGNQTRMGKGKGSFDHWACRVPTGKVLFEIKGDVHDRVAREAMRKAADKLPGLFEIIDANSKVRVSTTDLIDKPSAVNYVELIKQKPTKKWTNIEMSKLPEFRLFRGR